MEKRRFVTESEIIAIIKGLEDYYDHDTFRPERFLLTISDFFQDDLGERLLFKGLDCEVLAPGQQWQKGKLKLVLEFVPDEPEITEPESPLDEIREEISQLQQ